MPRVSGTMQITDGTRSGLDVCSQQSAAGVDVTADLFDSMLSDIAREITNSIAADGSTVVQNNVDWGGNKITNLADGTADADAATYGQLDDISPIGEIKMWVTGTIPARHLEIAGQTLSRATYATLWSLWGPGGSNICGAGDGSTTFTLPDWRGRMPFGQATTGTGSTLGSTFGSVDHVHTGPSHTHTLSAHTHSMQSHTHTGPSHTHSSGSLRALVGFTTANSSLATVRDGAITFGAPGATHYTTHDRLSWSGPILELSRSDVVVPSSIVAGSTDPSGTGATGGPSVASTGVPSADITGSGGTGNTGSANPPCFVCKFIVRAL